MPRNLNCCSNWQCEIKLYAAKQSMIWTLKKENLSVQSLLQKYVLVVVVCVDVKNIIKKKHPTNNCRHYRCVQEATIKHFGPPFKKDTRGLMSVAVCKPHSVWSDLIRPLIQSVEKDRLLCWSVIQAHYFPTCTKLVVYLNSSGLSTSGWVSCEISVY